MKKWLVFPVCLNGRCCSSGCVGNVLTKINKLASIDKDEGDESLPFLPFLRHDVNAIFLKYSKKGRLSSSHVRIPNIPSDVCYDDTPGAI